MAVKARYTDPIQVVTTPRMRQRIMEIANREEVSQASVVRDILERGIEARERLSQKTVKA